MAQTVKNLPGMQETWVQSLGWEDPEMATHSRDFAHKIPQMEEPRWIQSMWSQRVGHNEATNTDFQQGIGSASIKTKLNILLAKDFLLQFWTHLLLLT